MLSEQMMAQFCTDSPFPMWFNCLCVDVFTLKKSYKQLDHKGTKNFIYILGSWSYNYYTDRTCHAIQGVHWYYQYKACWIWMTLLCCDRNNNWILNCSRTTILDILYVFGITSVIFWLEFPTFDSDFSRVVGMIRLVKACFL